MTELDGSKLRDLDLRVWQTYSKSMNGIQARTSRQEKMFILTTLSTPSKVSPTRYVFSPSSLSIDCLPPLEYQADQTVMPKVQPKTVV